MYEGSLPWRNIVIPPVTKPAKDARGAPSPSFSLLATIEAYALRNQGRAVYLPLGGKGLGPAGWNCWEAELYTETRLKFRVSNAVIAGSGGLALTSSTSHTFRVEERPSVILATGLTKLAFCIWNGMAPFHLAPPFFSVNERFRCRTQ